MITGMGILAPNGNSLDEFWHNTLNAVSGIAEITRFPIDDFPVKVAGEVKNFKLERFLPSSIKVKPKRMGLHTQFGIAAAHMAIRHAGLTAVSLKNEEPIAFYIGVSTSAIEVIERGKEILMNSGPRRVSPYTVGGCQPHAVVSEIVETLGVQTKSSTFASACPSGLEAIGTAMHHIRSGQQSFAICGGVDAPITPLTMASFHLTRMIVSTSDTPSSSGRPFDAERQGGVIGEGGSIFVIESLESALSRGATPLAEIMGFGKYSDIPGSESASGIIHSMENALEDAAMIPNDIDYINAHGPGHPVIDVTETKSIKELFGDRAYQIPVSSIKGVIGNPLAAAGGMQMASSVMAMREGRIPPTANYHTPDPDCDLNYVPNSALDYSPRNAMINLHGLGGGNISLIVQRLNR